MIRAILALIAVSTLVVVLVLLTIESRSVNEAYYLEYAEEIQRVGEIRDDLSLVATAADAAFTQGRETPQQVSSGLERLAENQQELQRRGSTAAADVASATSELDAALTAYVSNGRRLAEELDAFSSALRIVQEDSPAVIRDLRDRGLEAQSRELFAFTLDLMAHAAGQDEDSTQALTERLGRFTDESTLSSEESGLIQEFAAAAARVLEIRAAAATSLQSLQDSAVLEHLQALENAINVVYSETNSRAERARLLLSVCAMVLVAGVAFVLYRLQSSYRALNRSNEELARVNESLEERVAERTAELSSAYDELKDSQVQLVQAEKMSSLGELVAGISHEINTPLWYLTNNATTVKERLQLVGEFAAIADGMIEALCAGADSRTTLSSGLTKMRKMLTDGLRDDLDEADNLIDDSIEGLEELTELAQSLKDFSRLDRAQSGRFNVNDGIEKTLLIARNKLKNRIDVVKDFGDVPDITCAPSQINQVFLNLLTNAADAIEDSGEIRIRTWKEDGEVCIRIEDTGCGIPDDVIDQIRNPFFTTKEVGKGTGLGMSIVDRIIDAHDGHLEIQSTVGRGTVMTIRLPADSSAESADEEPDDRPNSEDDPTLPGIVDVDSAEDIKAASA